MMKMMKNGHSKLSLLACQIFLLHLVFVNSFVFANHDVIEIMSVTEAAKKRPSLNFKGDLLTANSKFYSAEKVLVVDIKGVMFAVPLKYFDVFEVISLPGFNLVMTYCSIIESFTVYTYEGMGKNFYVTGKLYKGSLIFMDENESSFKHISGRQLDSRKENYLKPHPFMITDVSEISDEDSLYLYLNDFKSIEYEDFSHMYRIMTSFMFSNTVDFLANVFNFNRNQNNMVVAILNRDEKIKRWEWLEEKRQIPEYSSNLLYLRDSVGEKVLISEDYNGGDILYRGNMRGLILLGAIR